MQSLINRRKFLHGLVATGSSVVAAGLLPGCRGGGRANSYPVIPPPSWDPAAHPHDGSTTTEPASSPALFNGFLLGGFECSTHYRKDGQRNDIIAMTRHDTLALADYRRLRAMGMTAARDGVRWHLIEPSPGQYRFDSLIPMASAARLAGINVIWDLMHYGWPDHVDIYSADFPKQFTRFCRATIRVLLDHATPDRPFIVCPINEMSFLAWAGGDFAYLNPYDKGRGAELKRQLVRAAVEAMSAMKEIAPHVRFMHCDPLVHVIGRPRRSKEREAAEAYRLAQFQAFDMLAGDVEPGLGGKREFLDIIGLNYYRDNQSYYDGTFIGGDEADYRPLADMLLEVWRRYDRPMLIAETGAEEPDRTSWFRYVASEVGRALLAGAPIHGMTWYPILDHPGWQDGRHCRNGLWGYANEDGDRPIVASLAAEMKRQTPTLTALRSRALGRSG